MTPDNETVVMARIDKGAGNQATEALAAMGLWISDAMRRIRIAADTEGHLPMTAPSARTREAVDEQDRGEGKRFASGEELFRDLGL